MARSRRRDGMPPGYIPQGRVGSLIRQLDDATQVVVRDAFMRFVIATSPEERAAAIMGIYHAMRHVNLDVADAIDLLVLEGPGGDRQAERQEDLQDARALGGWLSVKLPDGAPAWRRQGGKRVLTVCACTPRCLGWFATIDGATLEDGFGRLHLFASAAAAQAVADARIAPAHTPPVP